MITVNNELKIVVSDAKRHITTVPMKKINVRHIEKHLTSLSDHIPSLEKFLGRMNRRIGRLAAPIQEAVLVITYKRMYENVAVDINIDKCLLFNCGLRNEERM